MLEGHTGSMSPMSTLKETLNRLTVDQLKALMAWLPEAPRAGRKDELVERIQQNLSGDKLHALWDRLDELQRLAVAETAHSPEGVFQPGRFRAKYGRLPNFVVTDKRHAYGLGYGPPTALALFLYAEDDQRRLPGDLQERLRTFVPTPAAVTLRSRVHLEDETLVVRHCEREALADLPVLLRLVDQGKVQTSDKTALPGAATQRLLAERLSGGDFYPERPRQHRWEQEIGPIKGLAWPMLLQAGGLTQRNGMTLALSPAGLKALSSPPAAVLCQLWSRWLKSRLLDEFSRIDVIKGQKAKGRVLTAVAPRRAAIADALECCPADAWVDVDDFSCFMQATDRGFEVAHDPWKLYLAEPEYGSLGHQGSHDWHILQLRYLLCFLFEYAAPLGLIDVAYREPTARRDYGDMWGADDLQFLSRYDGLACFRLTPLGAHCLELSPDYAPAPVRTTVRLSVLPSLRVNVVGGELMPEESLILEDWAERTADGSWRLDRVKALTAIEKGHEIAALSAFLEARDDQPLPEAVESFIKTCNQHGKALKLVGTALLIECLDAETAALIATHKETSGLCLRAGERHLVVRLEHEAKFRTVIRILGFGLVT